MIVAPEYTACPKLRKNLSSSYYVGDGVVTVSCDKPDVCRKGK